MLCEISFVTYRSELCIKSVFSCINPAICISLQYLLKALCSSFSQEASLNRNLVLPAAFKVGGGFSQLCDPGVPYTAHPNKPQEHS